MSEIEQRLLRYEYLSLCNPKNKDIIKRNREEQLNFWLSELDLKFGRKMIESCVEGHLTWKKINLRFVFIADMF